ncbi:MAG: HDOD domain-containing protein [Steroidobacteraceae bacterium]
MPESPQLISLGTVSNDPSPTLELREESFRFVRGLATELSAGRVDLPSFPDIAMRVRKALDDESVTMEQIARIVGSEAALAATIFTMASSPAMGYGGKPVTDLKSAVARVGLSNVRAAALAFSLGQLRKAAQFQSIREDLNRLWHRSTYVAGLARVIAMRIENVNPDFAMLAGLLHNIGAVYVLARIQRQPTLANLPAVCSDIFKDWTPGISRSIAENWGMPEEVVDAIGEQAAVDPGRRGVPKVADVLNLALLVDADTVSSQAAATGQALLAGCARICLNQARWQEILDASEAEITALQAILTG